MNDRAKRRIEMARDLLRLDPSLTSNQILSIIERKEKTERDGLRSAADWIERYEAHEDEFIWGK